jgi:hypothetical protein
MTGWGRTIEQADRRVRRTLRDGLFILVLRGRFAVVDVFDSGAELLADAAGWAGTSIDPTLADRLAIEDQQVRVQQRVSLRVLRADEQ